MKSLLNNDLVLTIEKNFEWKPSYDTQRSPFSPANEWYLIDHLIRLLCVLCSQKDGTLQTTSSLAFTASVYDNGRTFKCYAENSVTRSENMKPMIESMTIEVLCKWTIIFDVSVPCCRRHRVVTNEHASFSFAYLVEDVQSAPPTNFILHLSPLILFQRGDQFKYFKCRI